MVLRLSAADCVSKWENDYIDHRSRSLVTWGEKQLDRSSDRYKTTRAGRILRPAGVIGTAVVTFPYWLSEEMLLAVKESQLTVYQKLFLDVSLALKVAPLEPLNESLENIEEIVHKAENNQENFTSTFYTSWMWSDLHHLTEAAESDSIGKTEHYRNMFQAARTLDTANKSGKICLPKRKKNRVRWPDIEELRLEVEQSLSN